MALEETVAKEKPMTTNNKEITETAKSVLSNFITYLRGTTVHHWMFFLIGVIVGGLLL